MVCGNTFRMKLFSIVIRSWFCKEKKVGNYKSPPGVTCLVEESKVAE